MGLWWKNLSIEAKLAWASSVLLVVWLASGMLFEPASGPVVRTTPVPHVEVRQVTPVSHQRMVNVSGLTEAATKASIAAQTAGRVMAIPVERGQQIAKGSALVELDPADRTIRLRAAEAELTRARKLRDAARQLTREGYMAASVLTEREAAYAAARERVAAARLDLDYATIRAPFAGQLEDRLVSVGDYVNIGTPVAVMVDRSDILLVGYVAQSDRHVLRTGVTVSATLLDGRDVPATLRAIATDADPATRTYRVEAVLDDRGQNIPTGMSAALNIPAEAVTAVRVPHSWLVLGDSGTVGLMLAAATSSDTTVRFQPVSIINDTPAGVWVAGWSDVPALVVSRGQASLRDGGRVHASLAGDREAPQ